MGSFNPFTPGNKSESLPNQLGRDSVIKDLDNGSFDKIDFRNQSLAGRNLTNSYFMGCDFRGVNFSSANLSRSKFHNCWFDDANFHLAKVEHVIFNRCTLGDANLSRASFFKSIFPSSDVKNVKLKGVKNIHNRTRTLIGELLSQHAGESSSMLRYALIVGWDISICWESWQKIAREDPVYHHWVISVFKQYPESMLLETYLGLEKAMPKEKVADYAEEIHLETFPAHLLALFSVNGKTYAANTNGLNYITPENVLGELVAYNLDRKYLTTKEDLVDLVFKKVGTPHLKGVSELTWPYCPVTLMSGKDWEELASDKLDWMKEVESEIVGRILASDFLNGKSVLDPACSHGLFLEKLLASGFKGKVFGTDIVPMMLKLAQKAAPKAKISEKSMLEAFKPKVDLVVNRALAHFVVSKEDALLAVKAGLDSLNSGGKLILHTGAPAILDAVALQGIDGIEILQKVHFDGKGISAFYIISKP